MTTGRKRARRACMQLSRRELLAQTLSCAAIGLTPARLLRADERARFTSDPFALGVASGFPTSNSVVLWTRLAPRPLEPDGGAPAAVIPVEWELATDERLHHVVQQGTTYAVAEEAHSVHVEPTGLEPDRRYWYRFRAGGARSVVGRTRTAPAGQMSPARLRIAIASCQQYEHGYYVAYRHMLADDLDAIVHVGDYIYEHSWGEGRVRSHGSAEAVTLEDYRRRHALYRTDPDLQAAHASCPWFVTWDDHELANDYAGEISEHNDEPALFLGRRAAAYRAYYEHMPLPRTAAPFGPHMRVHADAAWGSLASLFTLDQRQYRSPQPCPEPGRSGGTRVEDCRELSEPTRTMLGQRQEQWLFARLAASRTRWNFMAQGTVMSHIDEDPGPGRRYWSDGWNGYPAARARLLAFLAERRVANPVVLSGDIHAFVVGTLNRRPEELDSPVVATELVTSSITSEGLPQEDLDHWRQHNPNLLVATSTHHGYLRLEISPQRLRADLVAVESVTERTAARRVLSSYVLEAGRPIPTPA